MPKKNAPQEGSRPLISSPLKKLDEMTKRERTQLVAGLFEAGSSPSKVVLDVKSGEETLKVYVGNLLPLKKPLEDDLKGAVKKLASETLKKGKDEMRGLNARFFETDMDKIRPCTYCASRPNLADKCKPGQYHDNAKPQGSRSITSPLYCAPCQRAHGHCSIQERYIGAKLSQICGWAPAIAFSLVSHARSKQQSASQPSALEESSESEEEPETEPETEPIPVRLSPRKRRNVNRSPADSDGQEVLPSIRVKSAIKRPRRLSDEEVQSESEDQHPRKRVSRSSVRGGLSPDVFEELGSSPTSQGKGGIKKSPQKVLKRGEGTSKGKKKRTKNQKSQSKSEKPVMGQTSNANNPPPKRIYSPSSGRRISDDEVQEEEIQEIPNFTLTRKGLIPRHHDEPPPDESEEEIQEIPNFPFTRKDFIPRHRDEPPSDELRSNFDVPGSSIEVTALREEGQSSTTTGIDANPSNPTATSTSLDDLEDRLDALEIKASLTNEEYVREHRTVINQINEARGAWDSVNREIGRNAVGLKGLVERLDEMKLILGQVNRNSGETIGASSEWENKHNRLLDLLNGLIEVAQTTCSNLATFDRSTASLSNSRVILGDVLDKLRNQTDLTITQLPR